MVAKVQIKRTSTPNSPPTGLAPGELAVEMASASPNLWVGVPTAIDASGRRLLNAGGITIADAAPASPAAGDLWWESDTGLLWLYYVDVDSSQWVQAAGSVGGGSSVTVADTAPASPAQGDLWWESDTAILWIWYDDGSGAQWVQAAGSASVAPAGDFYTKAESDAKYVELIGDTMSGNLWITTQAHSGLILNRAAGVYTSVIEGHVNSVQRWDVTIANGDVESGSNTGSNFAIGRHADDGSFLGEPLTISRATGNTTLGGTLRVKRSGVDHASVELDKPASGTTNGFVGLTNGLARWNIVVGDSTPEAGGNSGSDFTIYRYDDSGVSIGAPLTISRATGNTTLNCGATLNTGAGGPTIQHTLRVNYKGAAYQYGSAFFPEVDFSDPCQFFNAAATKVGNIFTTATTTVYNTTSDASLKEDLKSFDAGNIIDATKVYDFAWKSTGERAYGIVAQEANEVYPQAVTHTMQPDKGEWWGVDYSKYVPVLIQAIKELRQEVADLKAAVAGPIVTPQRRG